MSMLAAKACSYGLKIVLQDAMMGTSRRLPFLKLFLFAGFLLNSVLVYAAGVPQLGSSKGTLSMTQEALVSPDYSRTKDKNFNYLGVEFKSLPELSEEGSRDGLHTEIRGQLSPGNSVLNYFDLNQLFWRQDQFIVGRKKELWSIADEEWKLGLYQPLFSWNPLSPESQGLTGIFIHIRAQDLSFPAGLTLFGSPIFIPDQGPSYEIQDGKFRAENPYFSMPPSQAEFSGQTIDINYQIQKPDISEVVFNQSFAAKVYAGNLQNGLYAQASYAYKPSNQLNLGFRGFITADSELDVEVLPKVAYQRLLSADVKYSIKGMFAGVGAFQESLKDPQFESQWTHNKISPSVGVSAYGGYKTNQYWMRGGVLQIQGADKETSGPDSGNAGSIATGRFPAKRVWQVAGEMLAYRKGTHRVTVETTYRQGMENEFSLWQGGLQHYFDRDWAWALNYQLIAVNKNVEQNYYSQYENNDLLGVGVHYVF